MFIPGFYYDIYYLILVLPAVILAFIAQIGVSSTLNRYSSIRVSSGITGREAADMVLRDTGATGVTIKLLQGNFNDHFDPRTKTIALSEPVYNSVSVSAVGVAAHEAGHAAQYNEGYAPIKLRSAIIPVTRFGSFIAWPLIFIGLMFLNETLFAVGIAFFSLSTLFQLITLPVEFNASRRALKQLANSRMLTESELAGAKKVLFAAAMTYVAALAVSVAQLLRLLLIFGGRSNRRR